MPAKDRTGPFAQGPKTGRGFGPCGRGMGYGRGFGRGYGRGQGFRAAEPTREEEIDFLEQEMEAIKQRIKDLKKVKE